MQPEAPWRQEKCFYFSMSCGKLFQNHQEKLYFYEKEVCGHQSRRDLNFTLWKVSTEQITGSWLHWPWEIGEYGAWNWNCNLMKIIPFTNTAVLQIFYVLCKWNTPPLTWMNMLFLFFTWDSITMLKLFDPFIELIEIALNKIISNKKIKQYTWIYFSQY